MVNSCSVAASYNPQGDPLAMVCFKDPDGIYFELIDGLKVA